MEKKFKRTTVTSALPYANGGAYLHSTFDENGTLIRVERKDADGSRTETTFDSSGNTIAIHQYDASGALID